MALVNYNIDFAKLINLLLGTQLRKPIRIAWLKAVTKPLADIHSSFISFTAAIVNEIKWNGQTIILEQLLIEKFGAGIVITNNDSDIDGFFIGEGDDVSSFVGEGNDVDNYIDIDYSIATYDFTVSVPAAITFNMAEMLGYINKYKMFGATYNIVIV